MEYWEPRLANRSSEERLAALSDIYLSDDALCSVTVSVLRRLLGRRILRTERFQDGCGRCVFRIEGEVESAELFEWEPSPPPSVPGA